MEGPKKHTQKESTEYKQTMFDLFILLSLSRPRVYGKGVQTQTTTKQEQ